jgi:hypothetical protein
LNRSVSRFYVHASRIPAIIFRELDDPKINASLPFRFFGAQACVDMLARLQFQMRPQFLVEFFFHSPAANNSCCAKQKILNVHFRPPEVRDQLQRSTAPIDRFPTPTVSGLAR